MFQVPKEEEAFSKWLLDRWVEKETMLEQFYTSGEFPQKSSAYLIPPRPVTQNNLRFLLLHLFFMLSSYVHYIIISFIISKINGQLLVDQGSHYFLRIIIQFKIERLLEKSREIKSMKNKQVFLVSFQTIFYHTAILSLPGDRYKLDGKLQLINRVSSKNQYQCMLSFEETCFCLRKLCTVFCFFQKTNINDLVCLMTPNHD